MGLDDSIAAQQIGSLFGAGAALDLMLVWVAVNSKGRYVVCVWVAGKTA